MTRFDLNKLSLRAERSNLSRIASSQKTLLAMTCSGFLMMCLVPSVVAQETAPAADPFRRQEVISAIYHAHQEVISAPKPLTIQEIAGEVVRYSIKQGMLRIGTAKLAFKGLVPSEHDGESVLIHVTWSIPGFSNSEYIYVDPETFYPRFVYKERNKFGCKITILEDYFPEEGKVSITRDTCGTETQRVADRGAPVENIYAMIYSLRMKNLAIESLPPFTVRMPDKDENFKFEGIKKLGVARQNYEARHFASETFGIWLDPSHDRIPLRIDSSEEHSVTMVMKSRKFSADADADMETEDSETDDEVDTGAPTQNFGSQSSNVVSD